MMNLKTEFIQNAKKEKCNCIGSDHIETIDDYELVLAFDRQHGWFNNKPKSKKSAEITIQFPPPIFFDENF